MGQQKTEPEEAPAEKETKSQKGKIIIYLYFLNYNNY